MEIFPAACQLIAIAFVLEQQETQKIIQEVHPELRSSVSGNIRGTYLLGKKSWQVWGLE